MRVLVTGARGFIGRHLCKFLSDQNHDVLEWDLPDQDITGDLVNPRPLDAVVHLAAVASPGLCDRDPALAFLVNVRGTHNVLKMAVAAGAKRFILASSAHTYGIPPSYRPTDERAPLSIFDTYTTTKLLSEQICQLFYDSYGLSYTAIRLFNGYGPGQPAGYFIADKIQQAMAGDFDLRDHQVTKDWVYIDDVVRAYASTLESQFVGAINIGTGIETDLETIANKIAKAFGVQVAIQPTSSPPTHMCADISRAKRVLGWEPAVSLEEGLDATIAAISSR